MNEAAVREAIKLFIEDNSDTLLEDLNMQGRDRTLTVARSLFTPPTTYYWTIVHCDAAETAQRHPNVRSSTRSTYQVIVELADYALPHVEEESIYEESDRQFRLLCDRLVNLVAVAEDFRDADEENIFVLVNDGVSPTVTKSNIDTIHFDEEGTLVGLILAGIIRFRVEGC